MIPPLSIGMNFKLTNRDSPIKLCHMKRKAINKDLKNPIRLTVYIDRETEKRLEEICKFSGDKIGSYIRAIIKESLAIE